LSFDPDTTSGGSYRQNQHAGGVIMPTFRNGTSQNDDRHHKIDPRLHE
jgi:hypothetical protein